MDNTSRKYLQTGILFYYYYFFKSRKAEASTFINAFSYFQYGLYVQQLEFLVSIHYIKASNVLRNWGSGVFLKCIFVLEAVKGDFITFSGTFELKNIPVSRNLAQLAGLKGHS